jgi:hypothetical protein
LDREENKLLAAKGKVAKAVAKAPAKPKKAVQEVEVINKESQVVVPEVVQQNPEGVILDFLLSTISR